MKFWSIFFAFIAGKLGATYVGKVFVFKVVLCLRRKAFYYVRPWVSCGKETPNHARLICLKVSDVMLGNQRAMGLYLGVLVEA